MDDIVIRAENLSKRYRIGSREEMSNTFVGAALSSLRKPFANLRNLRGLTRFQPDEPDDTLIWALKDVSFEVKRGEILGIIGRNGAGKSTLLKILSRITYPTGGRVEIKGRVSSLLEVGTGFHRELTGRENIYLNGAILGMTKGEIDRKFDEIVDFSGVEKFIDTPVKHYSSGMYVRLAFAVAAHLEPEILLVDEVLAVGDAEFQKKCLGKMGEVAKGGRTVLFVSHNMGAVRNLCRKSLLLKSGMLIHYDETDYVINKYNSSVIKNPIVSLASNNRKGDGTLQIVKFDVLGLKSNPTLVCGEPAELRFYYEGSNKRKLDNVSISVGINSLIGTNIIFLSNELTGNLFSNLPQIGVLKCNIPQIPLAPGMYSLNIYCTVNGVLSDWIIDGARINIEHGDFFGTGREIPQTHTNLYVQHSWSN